MGHVNRHAQICHEAVYPRESSHSLLSYQEVFSMSPTLGLVAPSLASPSSACLQLGSVDPPGHVFWSACMAVASRVTSVTEPGSGHIGFQDKHYRGFWVPCALTASFLLFWSLFCPCDSGGGEQLFHGVVFLVARILGLCVPCPGVSRCADASCYGH